ncbi:MAG: Gfo/Idh/MocA family protein [Phycisphaerales bacterium JB039]
MTAQHDPLRVGIVGCGAISEIYLKNLRTLPGVTPVAVADLASDRAKAKADAHGLRAQSTDGLLAADDIDLILNLTTPDAHVAVASAALQSGKHAYNEKPLAVELEAGRRLVEAAELNEVRLGCAPDTVLGAGIQTCRRLIDEGAIGEVVGGIACMACRGHESWHPDPAFYYKRGGGPLLDMGPYYLTALVTLLGPVQRVAGSARASFATRTITSEPRRGETIEVEVPTHVAAVLDFASGAIVTLIMSFDTVAHRLPIIELYGAGATLAVPDPNTFGGPIQRFSAGAQQWETIPLDPGYSENSRGLGVAELAASVAADRPHAASGDLALHVLEICTAINEASETGAHVDIRSAPPRPDPLDPALIAATT